MVRAASVHIVVLVEVGKVCFVILFAAGFFHALVVKLFIMFARKRKR